MKKIKIAIPTVFRHTRAARPRADHPRAQSMTEFALALPVLLMLIFGIIEFGRIMQAWLALENGARFGVRFASTGNFNPAYCDDAAIALEHVFPGIANQDLSAGVYDCQVPDSVDDADDRTAALQDYARLPSIRDAAISGATGIAWDSAVSGNYVEYLRQAYLSSSFTQANRGIPAEEGYLNVMICSNRVHDNGDRVVVNNNAQYYSPYPPGKQEDYRFPAVCEVFSNDMTTVRRFIDDAGGPGDRVRVVLTYRHPLIMPFLSNWWNTLRLTSEREALVEKFRNSRVTGLTSPIVFAPSDTPVPTNTPLPAQCEGAGSVLREIWTGVSGSSLSNLTSWFRYPYWPNVSDFPTSFDMNTYGDNYGSRWRAYLCPPYDGAYTFYISSDDYSELRLNSSGQDAGGAAVIASVNGYTSYQQWAKYGSQKSAAINLQGGQLYYIEAIHKEGTGGDSLSVGWSGPTPLSDTPAVIQGSYLVPLPPQPTPTPEPASCDQLTVLRGAANDQGETLLMDKDGTSGQFQAYLRNEGPYPVYLLGANLTYNNGWHDEVQGPPATASFNRYTFAGASIFDPGNRGFPLNHDFTTPKLIDVFAEGTFGWDFAAPTRFGFMPHVVSYPPPAAGVPTAVVNPYPGPGTNRVNYYWSSDFSGSVEYKVVPTYGPTVVCTASLQGNSGPSITAYRGTTAISGPFVINAPFYFGATVSETPEYVFFYVYDSTGDLVHWFKDTSSPFCFNNTCTTMTPNVDRWWMGGSAAPGDVITNGSYTLEILAQDKDPRRKASRIVETFTITAPTPTNTNTATRTLTPSRTPLPTSTFTPSRTPTVTRTGTNTNTPLPTNTRSPSRTPTPSLTPTKTPTPTACLTPFEMGGCR